MKNQYLGLIAVIGVILMGAWSFTHRIPKIGYAETSILMSNFNESVKAKGQFESAQKGWDRNLKILNDSLMASMERMKNTFDVASKEEKVFMRAELETRNDDLQRYTTAVKKLAEDKERELMNPVIQRLNSFLDTWGMEHGYDIILGTVQGGSILQANPRFNLTNRILKDLNQTYKDLPIAKLDSVSTTPSLKHSDSGKAGN